MSAADKSPSRTSITVSPPLREEKDRFPRKKSSIDSTDSAVSESSNLEPTLSRTSIVSSCSDTNYLSDASNRSRSSATSSSITKSNRSSSMSQNENSFNHPRGRQHVNIPSLNSHANNARSPLRSSQSNSAKLNATRTPQNPNLYNPQSQRRGSVASVGEAVDFSTSLGMPYSLSSNSGPSPNSSMSSHNTYTNYNSHVNRGCGGATSISGASSPRNSFSSTFAHVPLIDVIPSGNNPTGSSSSSRRCSETNGRKPSTEEVFDMMEREQDGIVLRLMKEITQLKEENRDLRQKVNQLTAGNLSNYPNNSRSQSRSQSRSSIDSSRRRRNSTLYTDDELVSVSSSISTTPRSTFASLAQAQNQVQSQQNGLSRKSSINIPGAYQGHGSQSDSTGTMKPPSTSPNYSKTLQS